MGHRALVAYERSDSTYNLHYSHWGAANLQLKHRLTRTTPFGGECPSEWARDVYDRLVEGAEPAAVADEYDLGDGHRTEVELLPRATGVAFRDLLEEHLNYLSHEALYVVDQGFDVTAYRTLWFGLQYETDRIDQQPTVGFGAIRTIRWYDGEPVGDGYAQGEFAGMKRIVGKMIYRGVFDAEQALRFLREQLAAATPSERDVHFGGIPQ